MMADTWDEAVAECERLLALMEALIQQAEGTSHA